MKFFQLTLKTIPSIFSAIPCQILYVAYKWTDEGTTRVALKYHHFLQETSSFLRTNWKQEKVPAYTEAIRYFTHCSSWQLRHIYLTKHKLMTSTALTKECMYYKTLILFKRSDSQAASGTVPTLQPE